VIIRHHEPVTLGDVLGVQQDMVSAQAIAWMRPSTAAVSLPPAVAVTLYPAAGSFDGTKAATREDLTCANCPSLLDTADATIQGEDGALTPTGQDQVAVVTSGAVEVGAAGAKICDPDGGGCTGALGLDTTDETQSYYCTGTGACNQVGPGGDLEGDLTTSVTTEAATDPPTWAPTVTTTALPTCGALELNGDTIVNSYEDPGSIAPSSPSCTGDGTELVPGIYSYIVINHGTYSFAPGLYDITGAAPSVGVIDHSGEIADTDLCPQNQSGCALTAGVWITGGESGAPTVVSGTGVSFLLTGGGFVATHEVASLHLTAPRVGGATDVGGAPLLIDLQAPGFIHLDCADPAPGAAGSLLEGLLYVVPDLPVVPPATPGVTGGVELSTSLGSPELQGQVMAPSLYLFSDSPVSTTVTVGVDFTDGYPELDPVLPRQPAVDEGLLTTEVMTQTPGWSDLTVTYTGDTPLDAYRLYVSRDLSAPEWFSEGVWPTGYTGDHPPLPAVYPELPPPSPAYVQDPTDVTAWTYIFPDGSSIRVSGDWTWGPSATPTNGQQDTATVVYRFPDGTAPAEQIAVQLVSGEDLAGGGVASPGVVANFWFAPGDEPGGGEQIFTPAEVEVVG
jgi:hypothetical protein